MTNQIDVESQNLKLEQLSDLDWALRVLDGRGTPGDSLQLAEWMLNKLSKLGVNDCIRNAAQERLQALRAAA